MLLQWLSVATHSPGEMQAFVLGALRAAQEPVTLLEIAFEVVKGRGLDPDDPRAVSLIRKRVGACLYKLQVKGLVREVPQTGTYKGWEIAVPDQTRHS